MSTPPPVLDLNGMLTPTLAGGLDPARLREGGDLAERFAGAHHEVEARRAAGDMGFYDLPYQRATAERVRELADGFGQWFEDVVVLGIGGSALGALALRDGLLGLGWNERSQEERGYYPRLTVLDNPDPDVVRRLFGRIDPRRTLFNVISKSGGTAETVALYLVARERVAAVVEEEKVRGHFLFTTDPDKGPLRRLAEVEGIPTLPVPANVGGRFSVLSPVGLLPAAVAGIDVDGLLDGAASMEERCRTPVLARNPAGLLAVTLHALHTERGMGIHVLMPYADRLRTFALWFQQLWAESLGKRRGDEYVGPTPLPALGAVDQHAQVQLFMEGPADKVVVFVRAEPSGPDVPIPGLHADIEELAYLGGHSLGELLDSERRATADALRRAGRPTATLDVGALDARVMGGLILLLEAATAYAGSLYGVDPLDQPGVELGKRLTYGLMGRSGYPAPELPEGDPRWRV
jgi:glucose-6-phosphate isomerase